tara:strand:+ start:177 stop:431 length:255 start_codon:yes stop_codon:yes gene_type:complete
MRFPLTQLYGFNKSKPIVEVYGVEEELQWDYCDLEGLPPEREKGSMNDHGAVPKGQYNDLPETFVDMKGNDHRIEDIYTLRSSK